MAIKIWLGTVRQWHWISSALCLVGMLLFAVTGITLNHAAQIQAKPRVISEETQVPDAIWQNLASPAENKAPLPEALAKWLADELNIHVQGRMAEWDGEEIYVSLPRPGGEAQPVRAGRRPRKRAGSRPRLLRRAQGGGVAMKPTDLTLAGARDALAHHREAGDRR